MHFNVSKSNLPFQIILSHRVKRDQENACRYLQLLVHCARANVKNVMRIRISNKPRQLLGLRSEKYNF